MQPVTLPSPGIMQPHRVQIPIVPSTNGQPTSDQRDDTPNVDRIPEFDDVKTAWNFDARDWAANTGRIISNLSIFAAK